MTAARFVTDAPSSITAGQSAGVQIRFTPTSAGVKTSTVTLTTDDPASPYVFTIKGTATNSPVDSGEAFTDEQVDAHARVVVLGASTAEDLFGAEDPDAAIAGLRAQAAGAMAHRH